MVWQQNPTRLHYFWFISSIPTWYGYLKWVWNHAILGRLAPADAWYVPESEHPRIVREARIWLAVFITVWVLAALLGIAGELFILWIVARLVGEPFMRMVRVSEHWECEETGDLRKNTRSTQVSRLLHFLAWNMDYDAEHHLAPLTPFHQLPKLHEKVGEKLHEMGESHPAVHRDVLEAYCVLRIAYCVFRCRGPLMPYPTCLSCRTLATVMYSPTRHCVLRMTRYDLLFMQYVIHNAQYVIRNTQYAIRYTQYN